MLHQLRKLKDSLGRTLTGLLLLAWLGASLLPCMMPGSPATHHGAAHDAMPCCPSSQPVAHDQPAADTPCSPLGCSMQASTQQAPDLLAGLNPGMLLMIALLFIVNWPRRATAQRRITLRAPPPRPHPTLAYCTLLI